MPQYIPSDPPRSVYSLVVDLFDVIRLYPLVKIKQAFEQLKVAIRYWPRFAFFREDLRLSLSYLGQNPYRICRRYLAERGMANLHTYGETPLTTLEKIAKWAELTAEDVVYDLGCGPGRGALWLSHFIGCQVVGVEQIPQFVKKAKRLAKKGLQFIEGDMLQLDYEKATAIYLYSTSMEEGEILALLECFERMPKGVKVITVSFPLTDYVPESYQVTDVCEGTYPWGKARIYLNIKMTPQGHKALRR